MPLFLRELKNMPYVIRIMVRNGILAGSGQLELRMREGSKESAGESQTLQATGGLWRGLVW